MDLKMKEQQNDYPLSPVFLIPYLMVEVKIMIPPDVVLNVCRGNTTIILKKCVGEIPLHN